MALRTPAALASFIVGTVLTTQPVLARSGDANSDALERRAAELVEHVEESGRTIRFHTSRLDELVRSPQITSWSHYEHLDQIKSLVNRELRPAIQRLRTLQNSLPEWKRESIDRMLTAAQELAADTSSAFFAKRGNPSLPPMMNAEYRSLLENMTRHADALVSTADAAHAFAVGRLKALDAGLAVR